jgi:putative transposase
LGFGIGAAIAKPIRHRPAAFGDNWHPDEVVVSVNGLHWWLWRAVEPQGTALDALVQTRRNRQAAQRLMPKLIRRQVLPRVMITDKLKRLAATKADLGLKLERRQDKGLNNRAENYGKTPIPRTKIQGFGRRLGADSNRPVICSDLCQFTTKWQTNSSIAAITGLQRNHELRTQAFAVWRKLACAMMVPL